MEIEPHAVEQSLRRSHCQRSGYEHQCTGKMTVTAAGIELACVLCGSTASTVYRSGRADHNGAPRANARTELGCDRARDAGQSPAARYRDARRPVRARMGGEAMISKPKRKLLEVSAELETVMKDLEAAQTSLQHANTLSCNARNSETTASRRRDALLAEIDTICGRKR